MIAKKALNTILIEIVRCKFQWSFWFSSIQMLA